MDQHEACAMTAKGSNIRMIRSSLNTLSTVMEVSGWHPKDAPVAHALQRFTPTFPRGEPRKQALAVSVLSGSFRRLFNVCNVKMSIYNK